jgi:hypothetical protein
VTVTTTGGQPAPLEATEEAPEATPAG